MDFNPFKAVSNYSEMLDKISLFNFFGGILLFYILSFNIPELQTFINSYKLNISVGGNTFTFFNILIPFLIALISRIIKLHNLISDIFGIRKRYDLNQIIIPLARSLKIDISKKKSKIQANRTIVLQNIFYQFVSTDPNKCKINHHYVIMLMDQFAWYWIFIEYLFLILISIIFSLIFWKLCLLIYFLIMWVVSLLFTFIILNKVKQYTAFEIKQIINLDKSLTDKIKTYLNEL